MYWLQIFSNLNLKIGIVIFFGHLDTKLATLVEKVKLLDAKEQQLGLTRDDRVERLEHS